MLSLMPFGNRRNDLLDVYQEFEKKFFGEWDKEFNQFSTDIVDEGDHYLLKADLPGINKEHIHIDLQDNYLTISAEQNYEHETKEKNYVRRERRYGSFKRSFSVDNIRTDAIDASYENGVLELKLPKMAEVERAARRIEVK